MNQNSEETREPGKTDPSPESKSNARPTVPDISPGDPAALAIIVALAAGLRRLKENEASARRFEIEGVHQMRSAVRRLRSDLRTFRPMLDARWAGELSVELGWLLDLLGSVRDLDVLWDRLLESAKKLPAATLKPLFDALSRKREEAREALLAGLDDPRYGDLLARLNDALRSLPTTPKAEKPCQVALPRRVATAWKKLKKAARSLTSKDSNEAFHRVRILAKRTRYAAEAVAPALETRDREDATRFARRVSRLQDCLGELQDAVTAQGIIEPIIAQNTRDRVFCRAATRLLKRQKRIVQKARERFPKTWKKLDRKRSRRWLT